jgi:hypothetical protein
MSSTGQADPEYSKRFGKHLRDIFIAELTAGTNTTSFFPIDQIPNVAEKSAVLYDISEEFTTVSQSSFMNSQGFLGLFCFNFLFLVMYLFLFLYLCRFGLFVLSTDFCNSLSCYYNHHYYIHHYHNNHHHNH